ncbi:MAG: VOC family protein [Actinomycetota bacterium]|nr:VOC family protein [Actinomycetota bacterium]
MKAADQFHLGIVVDDIAESQARLTGLLGYEWGMTIESPVPVELPSGPVELTLRLSYSVTEPRLELVQEVADTLWTPARNGGVHHLGFWSEDLAADGAELVGSGFEHEASGLGGPDGPMWSYFRHPAGTRIELVSRALLPVMGALWTPVES